MLVLVLVFGYLLGSVPVGLIAVRLARGVDVRNFGSGNIGAANVFRVAGPWVGGTVLTLDAAKGALAVLVAGWSGLSPAGVVAAGLAAIAGHNWSVFLRFRGGKGVATGLGVVAGLAPAAAAIVLVLWVLLVLATGYSSVGSMGAAVAAPLLMWTLGGPPAYVALAAAGAGLVLVRHRANIGRLIRGEEIKLFAGRRR